MHNLIYQKIIEKKKKREKSFAVLLDPDKQNEQQLPETIRLINQAQPDFIFIGGSLISIDITRFVKKIKKQTPIPTILFPGSVIQITNQADALLFLSLISGRNPDFLIGNHVIAAPFLRKSKLEVISTGYILIGNNFTSVEYISNTKPIPANKPDIVAATAIAGELLGQKLIYLEAGSGAPHPVNAKIIKTVRNAVSLPLIVGGGIRNAEMAKECLNAGADILVVGTAFEKKMHVLKQIIKGCK